jgi:hypothetical protein
MDPLNKCQIAMKPISLFVSISIIAVTAALYYNCLTEWSDATDAVSESRGLVVVGGSRL